MSSAKIIMTDNECEWDPIKLTSYTGWLKKMDSIEQILMFFWPCISVYLSN